MIKYSLFWSICQAPNRLRSDTSTLPKWCASHYHYGGIKMYDVENYYLKVEYYIHYN